jgi:hypothetical protein
MIKLNKSYTINYGQGSIVFTEIDKGTVSASYTIKGNKNEGKIDGKLDGNVLKGTFHVDASAGLIEFTFSEDGFEAKWKQGIEPGPMRGKWEGNIAVDSSSELQEENTNENLNVVFVHINLGEFSDSARRPNMLDIQNKVNSVFYKEGDIEVAYDRIELTKAQNTVVELYFRYKHNEMIPEHYLAKLSDQIKTLSNSLSGTVHALLINENELNFFEKILKTEEYNDLTDEQMLSAKKFSDELEKKHQGIEHGPMRGKLEGNIGVDSSSELQEVNTNKKVHLIKFYLGCDDEGNGLIGSENAADLIYEKITLISSFIKEKIDDEVSGFLYEEFLESFTSIENKSINSTDFLDFIKNKLKSDLMRAEFESDPHIRIVFIFDPKEYELEVWHNEFPELSEHIDCDLQVFGYHSKFEDIVCQEYADGDYQSGIIYADLNEESISSYLKNEDQNDYFPQDSIFEQSNYRKK